MRTTVTLDDGIARTLKEMAHRTGTPFKRVLDRVLRAGLATVERRPSAKPYRTPTFEMGVPRGLDLDRALHLADRLEEDEIARKVALRK